MDAFVKCEFDSQQRYLPIFYAIKHDKYDDFVQLLGENNDERRSNAMKNLQTVNYYGQITPVMLACFYGRDKMLEYMLNLGNIDATHRDATDLSCLQHAAHINHSYYMWQHASTLS